MQPITLNTLFNKDEIKKLRKSQKLLVFFIFHLLALFVLFCILSYINYNDDKTQQELRELKFLNLDITTNVENFATLQENNLPKSMQNLDNFISNSRYVLLQNLNLKNYAENNLKIATELLSLNNNITKIKLHTQVEKVETISEDLLNDLVKLTQLKYTSGATLAELDTMSDLRTLSQSIAKNTLALKANTKYHPKIVFNINKDLLTFKNSLGLLTHGDATKNFQGIHDLESENLLKKIQEKFLLISDSINTILTHINSIVLAKNNYQQLLKNTEEINKIITNKLTANNALFDFDFILKILSFLLVISALVNMIIFIKNYNMDHTNLPEMNLQAMSNLINNLSNNNNYYTQQNDALTTEINLSKNNLNSVSEQYTIIADNLKNNNNTLSNNNKILTELEAKNNSILSDIENTLKSLQDVRITGSDLMSETEIFTNEVSNINTHSQDLGDLSEQINVLMFNIAIQSQNENNDSNENLSVVAEDIQQLAEQSSEKTKIISKQISDGQNAIKNLINRVENMLQQINQSLRNIENNKQQLNQINTELGDLKNQQNLSLEKADDKLENCADLIQKTSQNIIQIYTLSQQNNNNFFSDSKTIIALNNIISQLQNILTKTY